MKDAPVSNPVNTLTAEQKKIAELKAQLDKLSNPDTDTQYAMNA